MSDTPGDGQPAPETPAEVGEPDITPEEAFALLADETRFAILWALWEDLDEPMSFSELREAVGVEDSGKFNYHLGKLRGRFVRRDDDGYHLRAAGARVIGAFLSGTYTREATVEPIPVDTRCPSCGGDVEAEYADERVRVGCTDCETALASFSVPPGILDGYEREALPGVFARWVDVLTHMTMAGFCYLCIGRMVPSVDPEVDNDAGIHLATFICDRCGEELQTALGTAVQDHPAVVTFHADHGIDIGATPFWALDWMLDPHSEVIETDPLLVRVTVTLEGDTLALDLNDDLEVVAVHADAPA